MTILNINIFYDEGSTGKIVADIHTRLLRDGHDSHVIYGLGQNEVSQDSERIHKMITNFWAKQYGRIARITGLRYNCAYLETFRLRKLIKAINPGVVHLHCMNCSYINPFMLLRWLGRNNYNVLVTHHADVTITANCDHSYECEKWKTGCRHHCAITKQDLHSIFITNAACSWRQMKQAFSQVKHLYTSGVSKWMADRVKLSPFFKDVECRVIENGLDLKSFHYKENSSELREELGLEERKVILHVTPSLLKPIKGGQYVFDLARRMPEYTFLIVGSRNEHIDNLPHNVMIMPYVGSKKELARYYSMADLALLTSRRETFSMVTAECLSCGTPIVGFYAGAPETVALPEYSQFVEYGNVDVLEKIVREWVDKPIDKLTISRKAIERYDAENMYCGYLEYYKDILKI